MAAWITADPRSLERFMREDRERRVHCTLTGYGDRAGPALVESVSHDTASRLWRGLTGLAALWGAALLAVFIPLAHFILVPTLVVIGLYVFWRRWRTRESVRRASGTCPDCGTEQELEIGGSWQPPHRVTCGNCQRSLVLRVENEERTRPEPR